MTTVAETIRRITREHLTHHHGLALGQCLTAVGWVGGTVPEMTEAEGLVELAMSDVSGGAIAVGAALAGRRPIYIVRYQGFQWYNAPSIINYAAKSMDMWGIPCPLFVRSIGMDGGMGPVASSSQHGMFTRMPGITVTAPMTPKEYEAVWDHFMRHDTPMYVSEHRRSFSIADEMPDVIVEGADLTLLAISSTRLNAVEAAGALAKEGIRCNIVHLVWLKPFSVDDRICDALAMSKHGGVVLDSDFENGVAKSIAFDILSSMPGVAMRVLGLEDRAAGFAPHLDNLPPTPERIRDAVRRVVTR